MRLQFLQLLLAALGSTACTSEPAGIPFYIISNGETPSLGRPGLTPIGKQRAESCIPAIFSGLNIGLIITCTVDRDGEEGLNCAAANETAVPLATALGINISTCATGDGADDDCPNNTLQNFRKNSNQSVLFVWDSTDMEDLIENVDTDAGLDNDQLALHPDLIVTVNPNDLENAGLTSMNCTGIDGTA
ncbi:Phosphoglycerate mutase family [Mycena sanguinolenta]|uniref:Phosphoglycerate mutase family n=1 Tax=Mycena sanguinolenta TaxID=230812 RepID=A0A8H6ZB05_9AGAR|nr:Phosphoglycerate mutase family [Mycena sanguinolenta]